MTRIRELPDCPVRIGRTDFVESDDGNKKTVRLLLCCGYREVEAQECIVCTGFKNATLLLKIEHFMKSSRDLRFKNRKNG